MNKKFLQSVAAGIATLSLVASCSHFGSHKESNTCGAKNGCAAAKKEDAHKCASKGKEEAKKESHKHSKKSKKSKAKAEVKAEAQKSEAKSN